MEKGVNGISPVAAIICTLVILALTIVFFVTGHPVWGVIFALITIDVFADLVLSFRKG